MDAEESSSALRCEGEKTQEAVHTPALIVELTPPAPPIDPAVAKVLDHHFPDPADQAVLHALIPTWTLLSSIQWVINLIRQLAFNREKKRSKNEKIRDLADYAEGIFSEWKAKGKCSLRGIKEASAPTPNVPTPEISAAMRLARDAVIDRDDQLRARLDQLSPEARAELEAEWDRDNPADPLIPRAMQRTIAKLRSAERTAWCREELERRELAR